MVKYKDECVGCPQEGCVGYSCPNKNVEEHFCDSCGIQLSPSNIFSNNFGKVINGEELCDKCFYERSGLDG